MTTITLEEAQASLPDPIRGLKPGDALVHRELQALKKLLWFEVAGGQRRVPKMFGASKKQIILLMDRPRF
jgi:hypothetical protein